MTALAEKATWSANRLIKFPSGDLNEAISVARAIVSGGGEPCASEQIAAALLQSPRSGAFRSKVAAAQAFGLLRTVQNRYRLTELGFAITNPGRERIARANAFVEVALYRRVYEEFRNRQLPSRPMSLEAVFVSFGVAAERKTAARRLFDRSAQQAGYFDHGSSDRLIRPAGAGSAGSSTKPGDTPAVGGPEACPDRAGDPDGEGKGGGKPMRADLHPFVHGLLRALPEPDTAWAEEERIKWLHAAIHNFNLMYKGDVRITVEGASKTGSRSE